jgi:hypothetical protein
MRLAASNAGLPKPLTSEFYMGWDSANFHEELGISLSEAKASSKAISPNFLLSALTSIAASKKRTRALLRKSFWQKNYICQISHAEPGAEKRG